MPNHAAKVLARYKDEILDQVVSSIQQLGNIGSESRMEFTAIGDASSS